MAKGVTFKHRVSVPKKRKGVHSKNASKSQNAYKKTNRGQGK
jgi:hypothetical protein